jgi:hypothetical protein
MKSHMTYVGYPEGGFTRSSLLHESDRWRIVLVTMPHPEHGAEAWFVAIMVAGNQLADYFVLEHGCVAGGQAENRAV